MAKITKIEFHPPQGKGQQGLHGMIHAAFALMHHLKAKGQSMRFHDDEGNVVDYVPSGISDNSKGGAEITLTTGTV